MQHQVILRTRLLSPAHPHTRKGTKRLGESVWTGGYIACGWTRDGRDHPTRGRPEKVWVACPRTTTTTTTTRPFWVKGSMCTAHTAQQPNRRTTDFREHTSGQPGTTGGTLFFDRGLKASSSSRLSPQRWVGGSVSLSSQEAHSCMGCGHKAHP